MLHLGWQESVYWPILVEENGLETGWPDTERQAARSLHRLVCLIGLAWNEPWQVRVAPQLSSNLPPNLPEGWLAEVPEPFLGHNPQIGMRSEAGLPDWIQAAWYRLEVDDPAGDIGAALSLWHEGVLLQPEHPSFALVAFVACVEQIGKVLAPAIGGSRGRFWSALQLGTNAHELTELKKVDVYKLRSMTAHGSRMHGLETVFGSVVPPPALAAGLPDSVSNFVHQTVPQMHRAGQALLLRVLAKSTGDRTAT